VTLKKVSVVGAEFTLASEAVNMIDLHTMECPVVRPASKAEVGDPLKSRHKVLGDSVALITEVRHGRNLMKATAYGFEADSFEGNPTAYHGHNTWETADGRP
jgi:hypothetical protein